MYWYQFKSIGGMLISGGYVYYFCQIFQGLRLLRVVQLFKTLEYPFVGLLATLCTSLTHLYACCFIYWKADNEWDGMHLKNSTDHFRFLVTTFIFYWPENSHFLVTRKPKWSVECLRTGVAKCPPQLIKRIEWIFEILLTAPGIEPGTSGWETNVLPTTLWPLADKSYLFWFFIYY